jgi:hypothetical protein
MKGNGVQRVFCKSERSCRWGLDDGCRALNKTTSGPCANCHLAAKQAVDSSSLGVSHNRQRNDTGSMRFRGNSTLHLHTNNSNV